MSHEWEVCRQAMFILQKGQMNEGSRIGAVHLWPYEPITEIVHMHNLKNKQNIHSKVTVSAHIHVKFGTKTR